MKIFCEYCKNAIDIEKDKKCPTCNASYLNNKEFKKIQENQAKKEQIAREIQDFVVKNIKDINSTSKIMRKIFFIIFFLALSFIIFVFIKMFMFS